MGEFEIN